MTALIDGHNALYRLDIHGTTHEQDRRELLSRVRHVDATSVVFFDARRAPAGLPDKVHEVGVRVRYCRKTTADEAIVDYVAEGERDQHLVVTDDRELAGRARQHGARTLGVTDWFERRVEEPEPETKPTKGAGGFSPEDFGVHDLVNLDHPPHDLRDD